MRRLTQEKNLLKNLEKVSSKVLHNYLRFFSQKEEIWKDGLDYIVRIAIVGKYVKLEDAYLSVVESIKHGGLDYIEKYKNIGFGARKENSAPLKHGFHYFLKLIIKTLKYF